MLTICSGYVTIIVPIGQGGIERATEYKKYWNGTRATVYNYNMDTVREWEANGWHLEGTYYGFLTFWKHAED